MKTQRFMFHRFGLLWLLKITGWINLSLAKNFIICTVLLEIITTITQLLTFSEAFTRAPRLQNRTNKKERIVFLRQMRLRGPSHHSCYSTMLSSLSDCSRSDSTPASPFCFGSADRDLDRDLDLDLDLDLERDRDFDIRLGLSCCSRSPLRSFSRLSSRSLLFVSRFSTGDLDRLRDRERDFDLLRDLTKQTKFNECKVMTRKHLPKVDEHNAHLDLERGLRLRLLLLLLLLLRLRVRLRRLRLRDLDRLRLRERERLWLRLRRALSSMIRIRRPLISVSSSLSMAVCMSLCVANSTTLQTNILH